MKLRPTIFLSGVSSEFASFRDAVEIEVQKKDCFPLNQPSFGIDYRTIEEILRRNIGEADAVIHIVGFRFGFEPRDRPVGKPRRSYTQMEYDIARELNKPVYAFLSTDASVRDACPGEPPEDAEATELQLAHRQALEQSNNVRYSFQNKNELCLRAAGIPLLATADFRVDIGRIDRYAPAELIGRESELKLLDDAWLKVRLAEPKRPHILTFVALGGEGKTSLVAQWAAQLSYDNWPGCDSAFAWSFYSQGSRDQSAVSSDLFLKEAISFFGNDTDKEFAASAAGAYEKGQRLARIVGRRRALLILDGLEPLQYPPTSPTPCELKDAGITALLKGLAAHNDGLCIVTTRYSVSNLRAFFQTTAPEITLNHLSLEAGVYLLKILGVKGSKEECEKLVKDVKGHALTLNLLGTYLRDAHGGDIRRRDLIKLEEANIEEQGGHAFRVIEAYENVLEREGDRSRQALAVLQILGLFDRPVTADCFTVLLKRPAIRGLTEPLVRLSGEQRNVVVKRLEDAKLVTVNREASGSLVSLDAHPLVREYFAEQLRLERAKAWRKAHQRIYEYLRDTTPDKAHPTLEDLQPLYQAVGHGCRAGLQFEAFYEVYVPRICREEEYYSTQKLGAFASDLGAVACFFDDPWSHVSNRLDEHDQALLFNNASFRLRGLGRLIEAKEPLEIALAMRIEQELWSSAGRFASNLSSLNLTLGLVAEAIRIAQDSLTYADRGGHVGMQIITKSVYAETLYRAGRLSESETNFREAEQTQAQFDVEYLYSVQGFEFCDLLLSGAERAAWKQTLDDDDRSLRQDILRTVLQRATRTLNHAQKNDHPLLSIALDQLTLGRIALYEALHTRGNLRKTVESELTMTINKAMTSLRRANAQDRLLYGLMTQAWLRFLTGACTGQDSAHENLDEAWEIAERGPMRLLMADIHLYRARLFFREKEYPWESPQADLQAARTLIEQCGYWRRKEELEDAERVILKKSV